MAKSKGKGNKAHSAAVNRIARRYGGRVSLDGDPDVVAPAVAIEVETSATIRQGIRRLSDIAGPTFVAVTNKEAIVEALRQSHGTNVGVMDAQGEIVKQSQPPLENNVAE
jgi:hypothetical protein